MALLAHQSPRAPFLLARDAHEPLAHIRGLWATPDGASQVRQTDCWGRVGSRAVPLTGSAVDAVCLTCHCQSLMHIRTSGQIMGYPVALVALRRCLAYGIISTCAACHRATRGTVSGMAACLMHTQ
jgi:hypothetical protein